MFFYVLSFFGFVFLDNKKLKKEKKNQNYKKNADPKFGYLTFTKTFETFAIFKLLKSYL